MTVHHLNLRDIRWRALKAAVLRCQSEYLQRGVISPATIFRRDMALADYLQAADEEKRRQG